MNSFQRNLVKIVLGIVQDWEKQFATMPEVWIGLTKPVRRLTENERIAAKLGVTVVRTVLETVLEKG